MCAIHGSLEEAEDQSAHRSRQNEPEDHELVAANGVPIIHQAKAGVLIDRFGGSPLGRNGRDIGWRGQLVPCRQQRNIFPWAVICVG